MANREPGKDAEFEAVHRAHYDQVYRYIRSCLQDSDDVEDLTLQVFYNACKA